MDTLDGMKTFVAVVEAGSFTNAADRLSISKKLVSKYIAQLEDHLGLRLLHRTTRRISVTSEGQRYYDQVLRILDEIDDLNTSLRDDTANLLGLLRISAPSTFGELYLQPLLCAFHNHHPDISFDLKLSDSYVSLTEGGFDLAIRIGELETSSLIARKLGATELWTVASPRYLEENGTPKIPDDLINYDCIRDTNMRSGDNWVFTHGTQSYSIPVKGSFKVNSARSSRDLAVGAQGIALCPDYVVSRDIANGRLVRILCDASTQTKGIHAIFAAAKYMPSRVRTFIEFLTVEFSANPDWKTNRFQDIGRDVKH
ncbi:LysR family transcriptional regulator [Maritalea sp.]|uniref:LysR family transcriptional regulator n=1 Tax=Maritalea sp. TaxID=2003361 RepID=UPI003EF4C5BE